MTTIERWAPAVGLYEVSDRGSVRSPRGPLKPWRTSKGYWAVALSVGGVRKVWRVHALMMHAFVGPRPQGMLTRHLDDDKDNNDLANLAYGTVSDNTFDAIRNGRHFQTRKTACHLGHAFTQENTYTSRGKRECRTCRREASARARRRELARAS